MNTRRVVRFLGPAVTTACGLGAFIASTAAAPPAAAASCPDVEVVFARGTGEQPGLGLTGQAFVDRLRPRLGGQSVGVYAVDYPASDRWATGVDGVRDAGAHVVATAADCPQTQMVLGGYSQGAAVMGFVTSVDVPAGVDPAAVPKPLDPAVAEHVSAVVLYGMPNVRAMNFLNEPPVAIGPLYEDKAIELCVPQDAVCSEGLDFAAHDGYVGNVAVINQGADFAASRVNGEPPPPPPVPRPKFGN